MRNPFRNMEYPLWKALSQADDPMHVIGMLLRYDAAEQRESLDGVQARVGAR